MPNPAHALVPLPGQVWLQSPLMRAVGTIGAVPYQPNSGPPKDIYKVPLMVIYEKTFSTLCYISRPNGLQNILIADTILAEPDP